MNGEVYSIDVETMGRLISQQIGDSLNEEMVDVLMMSGRESRPLLAGIYDDKLVCFVGLIPATLISDTAYLWLYVNPTNSISPVVFGRHGYRVVSKLITLYPRILGHCLADSPRSIAWLRSLGAKFGDPNGPALPFEINTWTPQV